MGYLNGLCLGVHLIIKYARAVNDALQDSTLLSSHPGRRFLSLTAENGHDSVSNFIILMVHLTLSLA